MSGVLETVKVHEVAGVFRSREDLDGAVDDLLLAGFDRADIDLMASRDAVREKLGKIYIATEELPDIRSVPRQAYVARHEATGALVLVAGVLTTVGVTAAALSIVASGGALALALAASAIGSTGVLIARHLGRERAKELETQMTAGGLVLWVRTRSAERDAKAQQILRNHGAEAVRVHEIEIEKRLEDVPLGSLLLGDERLGQS
jgi:hypothetical protein